MVKKPSPKEEVLQKIKRLERAYAEFSKEIDRLRKELKKITLKILKRVEEERISKIKKEFY